MANLTKPTTFTAGTTIVASEVNNNFDTIYNDYNGNITNVNISPSAAIVETKITFSATGHGHTGGADGNLIDLTALNTVSEAQGDIIFRNNTTWVRLAKGTASQTLKMNSGATAPEWVS